MVSNVAVDIATVVGIVAVAVVLVKDLADQGALALEIINRYSKRLANFSQVFCL
jgi:hypothetical protein